MNSIKTLTEHILNNDLIKASECFDAILRQKIMNRLYEGDTKQINKQHRKEIEIQVAKRLMLKGSVPANNMDKTAIQGARAIIGNNPALAKSVLRKI